MTIRCGADAPTCHVKFDEATAILAGDALQALAFQIIAEDESLAHELRVRLITELARAAGTPGGMVAGQTLTSRLKTAPSRPPNSKRFTDAKPARCFNQQHAAARLIAQASVREGRSR
jgi:geranylgeranyl pyrophosphate synthase